MNKNVWIIIGVVIVVIIIGLLFLRGPSSPATEVPAPVGDTTAAEVPPGAQEAVESFFSLLAAGDFPGAYAAQASAAQAEDAPDAFAQAATRAGFTQYASGVWEVRSASAETAVFEGTITRKDDSTLPLLVTVVQEGGAWKIRSIGAAQ